MLIQEKKTITFQNLNTIFSDFKFFSKFLAFSVAETCCTASLFSASCYNIAFFVSQFTVVVRNVYEDINPRGTFLHPFLISVLLLLLFPFKIIIFF